MSEELAKSNVKGRWYNERSDSRAPKRSYAFPGVPLVHTR